MALDIIADTGFVVAVSSSTDNYHRVCLALYQQYDRILLPNTVLTEATFLIEEDGGNEKVARFLKELYSTSKYSVYNLDQTDYERTAAILTKYADTRLDFVDASVVAVAEQFNIRQVLTLDRRDFGMVKPRHCDYFELLP